MFYSIRPQDIPAEVVELCRVFERAGHRAWVVGGCLRDLLLGKPAADWDLATDAEPKVVQGLFPRVIPTGIQHGTVTIRHRHTSYEVTTLRGEGAYSDGRRPDSVAFVQEIRDDLARRDFTINAIAYDPVRQHLEDPFGGVTDLERKLIRAVGDPVQRFSEDGLRVLRGARFCASLEFTLEGATEAAIAITLDTFRKVSAERVREEWLKAMKAPAPSRAFEVMRRTGILGVTFPALAALPPETFAASLRAIDNCPGDGVARLAVLLWPLRAESEAVRDWLTQYRYSNEERERVLRLLRWAYVPEVWTQGDAEVRRFARAIGRGHLAEVTSAGVALARAQFGESSTQTRDACAFKSRIAKLIDPATPLLAKELAIGGKELMRELAFPPGPDLGKLIDVLMEHVLDDPTLNTPEQLLTLARRQRGTA